MSLDDLFRSALSLIETHNAGLEPVPPSTKDDSKDHGTVLRPDGYVDPAGFTKAVKAMGGTSPERLNDMTWDEILECMAVAGPVKPKLLAKDVARAFRGPLTKDEPRKYIDDKRVNRLSIPELVAAYDPNSLDPASPVAKKLKDISKGQKFLVFADPVTRQVDVPMSTQLLTELARGLPPMETITYHGDIRKVYAVGEALESYLNENPLYPGRPLRTNDVCDQTGRSWEGVPLEIRQLVFLAVQNGELKVNIDKAHDVLDLVLGPDPLGKLRTRYRQAALKYDELKASGKLPSMTMQVNPTSNNPGGPLQGGRRVNL